MFEILSKEEREEIMWQDDLLENARNKRNSLDFNCLKKFIGHSVYIKNESAKEIFCYDNFQIDSTTYNCLALIDGNNDCKTFIFYNDIYDISNINDNLYLDKISINAVHYNWEIVCAEKKPIPIKCDKCGHEFQEDEQIWYINQQGEYNSIYDGEWISKRLCENCLSNFIK